MIRNRLAALERAAAAHSSRECPICRGHPVATMYQVIEENPEGTGYREAERHLDGFSRDRITDDLRCRGCGQPVDDRRLFLIQTIKGVTCLPSGPGLEAAQAGA